VTKVIARLRERADTDFTLSQQLARTTRVAAFDDLLGREYVPVILYIDTDQLYMATMKLLLEGHGFKVLLARTRDHMRQVLLTNMVDLALVDHEFARECPLVMRDIRTISPLTRTVLLGMRESEATIDGADAYCARLDGPERLLALLDAAIERGVRKSAQRASGLT
jgi:DNA-binding response OmpR family regulator